MDLKYSCIQTYTNTEIEAAREARRTKEIHLQTHTNTNNTNTYIYIRRDDGKKHPNGRSIQHENQKQ